jgi:hypothetical protein
MKRSITGNYLDRYGSECAGGRIVTLLSLSDSSRVEDDTGSRD